MVDPREDWDGRDRMPRGEDRGRAAAGSASPTSTTITPQAEEYRFLRSGAVWEVAGFGERGHLPDLKGIMNLVQLLRTAGAYVPWADLVAVVPPGDTRSKQPAITLEAVVKIREERRRLQAEIDDAENDVERADSELRLAELNDRVKKDFGLGAWHAT